MSDLLIPIARRLPWLRRAMLWAGVLLVSVIDRGVFAQGLHVTTYHNDNARSGRYLNETQLSPATVSPGTFGLKFRLMVDGDVYAQPLFLSGVPIDGDAGRRGLRRDGA